MDDRVRDRREAPQLPRRRGPAGSSSCPRWPSPYRVAPRTAGHTRSGSAHGFRFSPPSNEPVTAETFKYTIERALSPHMHGYELPFLRDVVGADAYAPGRTNHIAGIAATGDTLTFRLDHPSRRLHQPGSRPRSSCRADRHPAGGGEHSLVGRNRTTAPPISATPIVLQAEPELPRRTSASGARDPDKSQGRAEARLKRRRARHSRLCVPIRIRYGGTGAGRALRAGELRRRGGQAAVLR